MTPNKEKTAILKKISDNPDMSLGKIAASFKISLSTLLVRMKEYGIEHGRRRGRKNGSGKKTLQIT